MNTEQPEARIHENAERTESGVEAAAASLANGAGVLGELQGELLDSLRNTG